MCSRVGNWERIILDAAPPLEAASSLAIGDLDGDGHKEIVVGGAGALLWYRPDTGERGTIATGRYTVGLALYDLDGDGVLEVVAPWSDSETSPWTIRWYDAAADIHAPWSAHTIDPACNGSAHDLLFYDIDGDGEQELVANAAYCEIPGVFIYKPQADPTSPWHKHTVSTGIFSEGPCAADLDGDGRAEIVHGPDWYVQPAGGPYAGSWERRVYAPSFREMCRTALVDVTGNGRDDIVIAESEYVDGEMAWYENRLAEQPERPWIEHKLERGLVFAHSLDVRKSERTGEVRAFVAEMAAGGWDQPYNWDARLIEYTTSDMGRTWQRSLIDRGAGTHQAVLHDIDGDGALEVVGKEWGKARKLPRVQIWKQREVPSPLTRFRHCLLDRDKPYTGTDILAVDIDGSGLLDLACGSWWYRNPSWERYDIPAVYQVHYAYDIDGDGRDELVATKPSPTPPPDPYYPSGLCADFCWLKPVDPVNGQWEEYAIGSGPGRAAWPHGTVVASLFPSGRPALVACYHGNATPEIFEAPKDPRAGPWSKRPLTGLDHKEEIVAHDLTGNGRLDLVTGTEWLENVGDGTFQVHCIHPGFKAARVRIADVNGNGRADVVYVKMNLDHETEIAHFEPVGWLENPGDPRETPWQMHVIDKVRSPHSLDVADLDGDGELEIVVAEHDPFAPYRARNRLLVYKKVRRLGRVWKQYVVDDRFEHHCGTRVFEVAPGRLGIASHGWADNRYVHLWTLDTA